MQSTKDESGWTHRGGGGGFARLHHSLYQKKRLQPNGIWDSDQVEDLSSDLLFTSSTGDSFHPSDSASNIGYNMQFLQQATVSAATRRNWQKRIDSSGELRSNWY